MKKKFFAFLLILTMLLGNLSFAMAADDYYNFSDVPDGHWAGIYVDKMVSRGIILGYPDGTFKPDKKVTYAEFIKMAVVGITGEGQELGSEGKHWAYNYYKKAVGLKLFTEVQIPEAKLDKQIIRADMALIASNTVEGTVPEEASSIIQKFITDIAKATNRTPNVVKAYYLGILAGYADNSFKPEQGLTRGESAAVIDRIINPVTRLTIDLEGMKVTTPPKFPDGRDVAFKDLMTTMTKIDPASIDPDSEAGIFMKYRNGGIYDVQQFNGELVGILYETGYRLDGSLAATDKQDARVKYLLQHFLKDQWENCYNEFKKMQKNYKMGADPTIIIKHYNGHKTVMGIYEYSSDITIYK